MKILLCFLGGLALAILLSIAWNMGREHDDAEDVQEERALYHRMDSLQHALDITNSRLYASADSAHDSADAHHDERTKAPSHADAALSSAPMDSLNGVFLSTALEAAPE